MIEKIYEQIHQLAGPIRGNPKHAYQWLYDQCPAEHLTVNKKYSSRWKKAVDKYLDQLCELAEWNEISKNFNSK